MNDQLEKRAALTFWYSVGFPIEFRPAQNKSKERVCWTCNLTLIGGQKKFCSEKHGLRYWYLLHRKPQKIKKVFSFKKKKFEKPKLYKNYVQIKFARDLRGNPIKKEVVPIKRSFWDL